jgi:cytochrome c oxidase assembly protein subunit 15
VGNLFYNPLSIHYLHRAIGFVVLAYVIGLASWLHRRGGEVRLAGYGLLAAVLGQLALGALTVILGVPVPVAVAHQAGAYIVCAAAVVLCHAAWGAREAQPVAAATADADGGAVVV